MYKSISAIIVVCGLSLGAVPDAEAHRLVYNKYDSTRHYDWHHYRERHMPRWLRNKKGFRQWYYRSSIRFNHRLEWWQLYEIYRWERRYRDRHRYKAHYGARHREYDWYRRYWRDVERRDRRNKPRRRHRYED